MVKLRKIGLKGFRGSRFTLVVDLGQDCKSIAVFGDNATGKSTLTDGVEWFFYDRVAHLWREDCEEEALRHITLGPDEVAEVQLGFNDTKLDGSKSLDAGLQKAYSNRSPDFPVYLNQSSSEKLVLRNAYLQDFILKTKSEKRDEIARIIGYEAVTEFRESIQRVLTRTERDPAYTSAKDGLDRCRNRLLKKFNRVPRNRTEYFQVANELVGKFKPARPIADRESYEICVQGLSTRIADPKKGQKLAALNSFRIAAEEFKTTLTQTDELINAFLPPYEAVTRNVGKIRSIDLVAFLSKGRELIETARVDTQKCPFCLKPVSDIGHLLREVATRIASLEAARREHHELGKSKASLVTKLHAAEAEANEVRKKAIASGIAQDLIERLEKYRAYANSLGGSIPGKFERLQGLDEAKGHGQYVKDLLSTIDAATTVVDEMAKNLALTTEEQELIQARDNLILLRDTFGDAQDFARIKAVYEVEIRSLSTVVEKFIKIQNTVLQDALDMMSEDVSKYYLYLHPYEKIDNIRLRILGDQGVEFIYSFHGREVHPPLKYLSESHLNSLGIALFLASVRLFNKCNGFFVLDDVVTSFDVNHRLRLLRLLQEEFSDYQVLLLTHEAFWFEMIKRDMPAASWLFSEVDWSYDSGISIKRAVKGQKELIELKRKQNHDVGNDVRKLLEMVLKEVAFSLNVKVPFRFNDANERRDVRELLSAVRGTVNSKCPSIKSIPVWQGLETCSLVASTTSHHPGAQVGKGDIDTILEDVRALEGLFFCERCNTYVSLKKYSQKDKKVYCSCGKKELEWKD